MIIGSTFNSIFQLLTVLFIFIIVLVLTYFTTRWIASYEKFQQTGKNLEIVESIRVSNNKIVEILRVGHDKYIIIGISKDHIERLGELSEDELVIKEDSSDSSFSDFKGNTYKKFKDILRDTIKKPKKEKND